MGLSRRQLPSPLGGSGAGDGLAETKPSRPRAEMPMKLPKRAESTERSMRSLQRRGCEGGVAARLEVERRNGGNLRDVRRENWNENRDFGKGKVKYPPPRFCVSADSKRLKSLCFDTHP